MANCTVIGDSFTDVLSDADEIDDSQPLSLSPVAGIEHFENNCANKVAAPSNPFGNVPHAKIISRPTKGTGQYGEFRSVAEIDEKYRSVFSYPFFNLVQSRVIEDALYSDKSMVVCAPTGSGKTVVFEMAIVHLLMELERKNENNDFKIIYMAPVKALCTERLTEWYPKFTKLGVLCIEVTGDTDVDFLQLNPYRIIITTPEKWDMLTRRWRDRRQLVEVIKLFLIDEVHILNDSTRGPVLEAVVSRMKTIEASAQSTHRIEQLQQQYQGTEATPSIAPKIRFVAVSATVNNPEDVAAWLGTTGKPAVYYKFGDECRPVKLRRVVEGFPCSAGTSIFKFDIILNYKLWPIIQKYYNGKPTLIFCNTRKSVTLTAETLSREITVTFNPEQKMKLTALASNIKNKKLQSLIMSGVGCHHAGLLFEERTSIEQAFRNRDLPILITTTTLAMGVNLPAHLVIIKNTQQYVNGAYQEYSISTVLQMVGRAGRPQFDTEATAVIMTRLADKSRYQALVGGSEPLQSYLHKRLPENLNSEAALGTVSDVAQCVQWLQSTFLSVRAAKDPKRYLGLPPAAPQHQISKKIEELCIKAMNGLAAAGLITMDDACCIQSTEAGRLMSIYYLDLETMKHIMKIDGSESLERMLWIVCESHELSDMHLRIDERRILNALNRNNASATIRFPMKGKINTRQMKLNCVIQAILGCLPIPDPSLNQEAMRIMRIANRVCKCLVAYVTRSVLISQQPKFYSAVLNTIILAKCMEANLWENSPYVSRQLKGIGPAFSTLLATSGKVNFMLLEESHPRDLERIMNKGPPAGNILRKQISLLPKYQLSMTPIDGKVVSIQLVLLNQNNLSENIEHLTAGSGHKSYVIIGDSENNLLLLAAFTDKDLIGMYDGSITYQITRKHGFEHKIFAHCISSTVAGIDARCEYMFKDLEPVMHPPSPGYNEDTTTNTAMKQTTITNSFKERKRKNTENEINHSKEKKKRESVFFEKFKNLKESFGKTSKVIKEDLDKSVEVSNKILQDLTHLDTKITPHQKYEPVKSTFFEEPAIKEYEINDDDFIDDEFIDEDKINNILNEIECEISKSKPNCPGKSITDLSKTGMNTVQKPITKPVNINAAGMNFEITKTKHNSKKRCNKNLSKNSNYNFIELLEKNVNLSDDDNIENEQNSFSDTIRTHIEKYLHKAQDNVKASDKTFANLIYEGTSTTKETDYQFDIEQDSVRKNFDKDKTLSKPINEQPPTSDEAKQSITNINQQKSKINNDSDTAIGNVEHATKMKVMATEPRNTKINSDIVPNIESNVKNVQSFIKNGAGALHTNKGELEKEHASIEITKYHHGLHEIKLPKCYQSENTDIGIDTSFTYLRNSDMPAPTNNLLKSADYQDLPAIELGKNNYREREIIPSVHNQMERVSNSRKVPKNYSDISKLPKTVNPVEKLKVNQKNQPENFLSIGNEVVAYKDILCYDDQLDELDEQENYNHSRVSIDIPRNNDNSEIKVASKYIEMKLQKNYITDSSKMTKHDKPMISTFHTPVIEQYNNDKLPISLSISHSQQTLETKIHPGMNPMSPYKSLPQYTEVEGQGSYPTPIQVNSTENKIIRAQDVPINLTFGNQSDFKAHQYNHTKLPLVLSRSHHQTPEENLISDTSSATHNIEEEPTKSIVIINREIVSHDKPMNFTFGRPAYSIQQYNCSRFPMVLPSSHCRASEEKEKEIISERGPSENHDKIKTLPHNTSLCNTRSLSNLPTFSQQSYDDTNYCNTSSQNLFVNMYSLSSNQVNVSTKETEDHVVRVIRKLRIDMDVTEIISEEMKSKENNNNNVVDQLRNEKEDINNVDNLRTKPNARILNYDENDKAMLETFRSQVETDKKTFDILPELRNPKVLYGTDPAKKFASNINHTDSNKQNWQHKVEDKDENKFNGFKAEDRSEKGKPNNVESVLQKYSNIMRNNHTRHAELSQTQIKVAVKESDTVKTGKPKRPFKISDIHYLNSPLPGALIEKPVNVTECFNMLKQKDNTQVVHNEQNISSQMFATCNRKEHEIKNYTIQEVIQNNLLLESIEEIPEPLSIEDLDMKDSLSNIDQTMFDPKTLLQYCNISNDEELGIVPPPPEFSDDHWNATLEVTPPMDCYEPMSPDEHEMRYLTCEGIHNRSIFEDHSQVELTPSKEIETWNLPQDKDMNRIYASSPGLNPCSFTMMRKNKVSVRENNLLKNVTKPGLKKLAQFKYNHKSKLNLRL